MKLQPDPAHRARVKEFLDKHDIELLVLLFTDIVGSVKLKQELGDPQAILLIKNHNELVRNIRSQFKQARRLEQREIRF